MKKISLHVLGKVARGYLRVGMFLTFLHALALLFLFLDAKASDPIKAVLLYAPLLEYILASAFVTLGGSLILELVFTDPRFAKKK